MCHILTHMQSKTRLVYIYLYRLTRFCCRRKEPRVLENPVRITLIDTSVFWPAKFKFDVKFHRPWPKNLDNPWKIRTIENSRYGGRVSLRQAAMGLVRSAPSAPWPIFAQCDLHHFQLKKKLIFFSVSSIF